MDDSAECVVRRKRAAEKEITWSESYLSERRSISGTWAEEEGAKEGGRGPGRK